MKARNLHQLAIIKREARGNTTSIGSKKRFTRKVKHKRYKDVEID